MGVRKLSYQIELDKRRGWKWSIFDGANTIECGRDKGTFADAVRRAERALSRLEAVRKEMGRS
jgi:hypothetical protein